MVVLYTFDPPNVNLHRNESVLMLRISIYTVIRELDDFISEILIYTNQPKELKKMLKLTSNKIHFLKINNRFSNFVKNSKLLKRYDEIFYDGDFIDENEHFLVKNVGTTHTHTHTHPFGPVMVLAQRLPPWSLSIFWLICGTQWLPPCPTPQVTVDLLLVTGLGRRNC
jgi:hypothetical protein